MVDDLVIALCNLNADAILIEAAYLGKITKLECRFIDTSECVCPDGAEHFTKRGNPKNNPWAPSADHWPVAARDGGALTVNNVRLAHRFCNQSAGGRIGGRISGRISGGKNFTHESRVRGGRIGGRLCDHAPGGRASGGKNFTHESRVRGGRIGGRIGGRTSATLQVECECGMTSTPGAMGRHFKKTNHVRARSKISA